MKKLRNGKVFFLIFFIFFLNCKKEKSHIIPYVSVNEIIYLSNPSNMDLQVVGGWKYFDGGSRGLLVYRNAPDEFKAYDRHCTFESSSSCGRVAVDSSNIFLVDTCCQSVFIITDGSPTDGPASFPLQQYRTSFEDNVLRIRN